MAMMMVGFAISFILGTESALCPSSTVTIDVTSAADVQNLTDVLACTGEGAFDIVWYPSVTIGQEIEVSSGKNVAITGVGLPSIRGADADAEVGSGTGMFSVSNGSTLTLNHLVLEGGNAEHGGAVNLISSSFLFVLSCAFANNSAENGGETTSLQCKQPQQSPIKVHDKQVARQYVSLETIPGMYRFLCIVDIAH